MDPTDRQLRVFLAIAEAGSLSKAAEQLDQTQSGLSKLLTGLEGSIGQPLFVRTGRGVVLTQLGETLRDSIASSFKAIDAALESLKLRQGVMDSTVRLATVHTLSYYFMADVVASFVSARPGINLSILSRSSREVVDLVEAGKADLGFVYDTAVDSAELVVHPLFDDPMCLIVQEHDPNEQVDLLKQPVKLVGFPKHYALRRMLDGQGLLADFVAEAETVDAMLKLVSSGVGACVLPSRIPAKLLSDHGLRKAVIINPMLRRRVVAVVKAENPWGGLPEDLLQCGKLVAQGLPAL
ncbi:LysR family transcriptional regulator [Stenotrophomonas rhizophila]|uniref:LysR family transcriptional regulator n=1 Tax=Stenotrophomonas rhizophila TaxID=216778 RepID=UPI00339B18EE